MVWYVFQLLFGSADMDRELECVDTDSHLVEDTLAGRFVFTHSITMITNRK
jgi:hypothetical protein